MGLLGIYHRGIYGNPLDEMVSRRQPLLPVLLLVYRDHPVPDKHRAGEVIGKIRSLVTWITLRPLHFLEVDQSRNL